MICSQYLSLIERSRLVFKVKTNIFWVRAIAQRSAKNKIYDYVVI